jgi:hypothetical protein
MKRATFWSGALAGVIVALSGMYVMERAQAQDGQGGFPRPGGQGGGFPGRPGGGGQGGFPGGGGGFPGGPPMMGMGGGGATMTATERYVYVLRGNTLYQFSAEGLKLLGKAELPQPTRQPRPEGGGFGDPPPPPSSDQK